MNDIETNRKFLEERIIQTLQNGIHFEIVGDIFPKVSTLIAVLEINNSQESKYIIQTPVISKYFKDKSMLAKIHSEDIVDFRYEYLGFVCITGLKPEFHYSESILPDVRRSTVGLNSKIFPIYKVKQNDSSI